MANLLPAPVAKAVQAKEVAQQGLRVSSFSHLNGKHLQKYMDFAGINMPHPNTMPDTMPEYT